MFVSVMSDRQDGGIRTGSSGKRIWPEKSVLRVRESKDDRLERRRL